MPNHCSNCLYVHGARADRDFFLNSAAENELDLHVIVPLDEEEDSYDGHIANWGTKWNCYETKIVLGEEYDRVYFKTAWCPYSPAVQKAMSKKFPDLKFRLLFAERGQMFQGYYISENNVFTHDQQDCEEYTDCDDACESECEDHECYLQDLEYNELYQESG